MADENREEQFKVIDRRPFTAEGELRKEVVAEQEREAELDAKMQAAKEIRQAANNAAAARPGAGGADSCCGTGRQHRKKVNPLRTWCG